MGTTDEQAAVREETHRFAAEVLRPAAMELDRLEPEDVIAEGSLLWDVLRKGYEAGYHTAGFPEALGGANLSIEARHAHAQEMGWGAADLAISIGVSPFPFSFAAMSGDPGILQDIVMPFVQDREARYIGCWALTEPGHGSDTLLSGDQAEGAFGVRARPDGDDWLISGQKSAWVSNGTIASHALLFLGVEIDSENTGGGVAVVPLDLPGVSKGKPLNKMGQRALNQGEIFFDDVRIPKKYMLVQPAGYRYVIESVLSGANCGMGALFSGVARAAFEEGLGYARQRVQGRKPISEHQVVQLKLMDMFTKVQAAHELSKAAMLRNSNGPAIQYAVASKVFCTSASFQVASDALQLHGGYGLAKGMLIEKLFRDARASLIEDGTNEVLSLLGARRIIDAV